MHCNQFLKSANLLLFANVLFVVMEIIPSAPGLSGDAARPNHLIKLSSVEDDGLGEELQIIWELEPGTKEGLNNS